MHNLEARVRNNLVDESEVATIGAKGFLNRTHVPVSEKLYYFGLNNDQPQCDIVEVPYTMIYTMNP